MKRFLAGMLTMLLLVVASFVVLFGVLREPGTSTPREVPLGPGVRPSAPPTDLAPDETWLGDVDLSASSLVTAQTPLRQVRATGTDVRVTSAGVRVGSVRLVATLPFEVAAAQIGAGVRLYDAGGGLAGVRRSAEILGIELTIRASGQVSVDKGDLRIQPVSVDVGLPGIVNDALSGAARDLVSIRQSITGLPEGLTLTGIEVQPDGFRVTLRGTDLVMAGPG
ncbi:LmeA family phospholipid-binding protein [Nostocoides sp.]|uniref:LmeA family phospholipid-binding protein n=1 Tax=Nostocoides sp. TaxID=1917966 RepID=UPI002CBD2ED8|nr:LmeA family phospholipid-binding protein [Tetrasphaera sp.]